MNEKVFGADGGACEKLPVRGLQEFAASVSKYTQLVSYPEVHLL